ncbi:MAG: glycine cleavage system aminomethyltransferase GcvT [Planctomycetes bacterium]|nr:glycine cleavage system aminomethyltransferase GcvT [Planctomycetota bacterium]
MKTTVLNPVHRDLKARLVEFGGYEMPVQYDSIVEEHLAVRQRAGLFDLCHMGRFVVHGPRAIEAVDHVTTNDVAKMKTGQIRYSLVCNERGGVRDDVLVYRMPDHVLLVVNASNRDKLMAWFAEHLVQPGASLRDESEDVAMIAIQGPRAESLLSPLTSTTWVGDLSALGYYKMSDVVVRVGGKESRGHVSRTGYTGEDGFELYVPTEDAIDLWHEISEHCARAHGADALRPCGLGARDTLRLEAGMPLYGHELDEETNPLEAGLDFAIKLKKPGGFIGRDAMVAAKAVGLKHELRAFTVESKRVAREGMEVFSGERRVGRVTSGAPSPTIGRNIALAYVERDVPAEAALEVQVRKAREPLSPHTFPFYKRG